MFKYFMLFGNEISFNDSQYANIYEKSIQLDPFKSCNDLQE